MLIWSSRLVVVVQQMRLVALLRFMSVVSM
jgi:hypothetical protein